MRIRLTVRGAIKSSSSTTEDVERGHHDAIVREVVYAALYRKQLLEEELAAS